MSKNSWSQKIVHQSERIRLQTKFILAFLFVSLFAVTSVAYVTNYTTSRALIDAVGNDLKNLSNSQGVAVGDLLLHQVELLQSLSLNEILINKANLANALYGNDLAAIQTVLQQKQGTASLTDVLLADNALREAQQNYLNAVIDFLKADLELKKLTGSITSIKN